MTYVQRRSFLTLLGSAVAAWPLAARAQQTAMPVIGYLNSGSAEPNAQHVAAFRRGLSEVGYVEGRNVTIEYRWANNEYQRLPDLAADLVRLRVSVIIAQGPAVQPARSATSTIPIVFNVGADPVNNGFVASLSRPGGNLTGVTSMGTELGAKRLELLREVAPEATAFAALVNPDNTAGAALVLPVLHAAAGVLGRQLHILQASHEREFDAAFTTAAQLRVGGLAVAVDPYFTSRSEQLAASALRHAVPAIYQERGFVAAGGLMGYGTDNKEMFRICGGYAGRILKGEKPADLPVQQATRIELIINMKTAKALGLTFPLTILGRADEVIE